MIVSEEQRKVVFDMHQHIVNSVHQEIGAATMLIGMPKAKSAACASMTHLLSMITCGEFAELKDEMLDAMTNVTATFIDRVKVAREQQAIEGGTNG